MTSAPTEANVYMLFVLVSRIKEPEEQRSSNFLRTSQSEASDLLLRNTFVCARPHTHTHSAPGSGTMRVRAEFQSVFDTNV